MMCRLFTICGEMDMSCVWKLKIFEARVIDVKALS